MDATSPLADAAPRFEVRVEPPAPPTRGAIVKRLLLGLSVLVVAVRWPYVVGASILLPALFAWLGFRVSVARRHAMTVRFLDDALETEIDDVVGRTPWEHVTDVKETADAAVIALPFGRSVVIPKAQLPADRRVFIDAMPAHVRFEVVQAAPAAKNQKWKTLGLWVALMVVLYWVYQVMGQR